MFKMTFILSRLRILAVGFAIVALLVLPTVNTRAQVDKETGVTVSGNKATLKRGFKFRKAADGKVFVQKIGNLKDLFEVACNCLVETQQQPGVDQCTPEVRGADTVCAASGDCRCQVKLIAAG
jgi:hypothetical protein